MSGLPEHHQVLVTLKDSPLVHLIFICIFPMGAITSLSGVSDGHLFSLCGDVCTVFKHETGFYRGPRAFKHQQIKARGFVPGTMDCCKFNVASPEMWMMLLFFSCLDDPVGLTRLQC